MNNIHPIQPNITFLVPASKKVDWERVVSDWLKTKCSHHTQRAYSKDIYYFLAHEQGLTLGTFLSDPRSGSASQRATWLMKFRSAIEEYSLIKVMALLPLTEGYRR